MPEFAVCPSCGSDNVWALQTVERNVKPLFLYDEEDGCWYFHGHAKVLSETIHELQLECEQCFHCFTVEDIPAPPLGEQ